MHLVCCELEYRGSLFWSQLPSTSFLVAATADHLSRKLPPLCCTSSGTTLFRFLFCSIFSGISSVGFLWGLNVHRLLPIVYRALSRRSITNAPPLSVSFREMGGVRARAASASAGLHNEAKARVGKDAWYKTEGKKSLYLDAPLTNNGTYE